jgi:hypothetical protein
MSDAVDLSGAAAAPTVKNRLSSRCAQQALLISIRCCGADEMGRIGSRRGAGFE